METIIARQMKIVDLSLQVASVILCFFICTGTTLHDKCDVGQPIRSMFHLKTTLSSISTKKETFSGFNHQGHNVYFLFFPFEQNTTSNSSLKWKCNLATKHSTGTLHLCKTHALWYSICIAGTFWMKITSKNANYDLCCTQTFFAGIIRGKCTLYSVKVDSTSSVMQVII